MPTWLDDVGGVEVVDGTGDSDIELPRRSKLRLSGAFTVADNPIAGEVEIGLDMDAIGETADEANALAGSHAARHVRGGADEIDGDRIDVGYSPSSYTRTPVGEMAENERHLTAHLAGIDAAIGSANRLVWQWNGVDTSQFDDEPWIHNRSGSGTYTATLEVVAAASKLYGENALRHAAVATGANGDGGSQHVWLITEPMPRNWRMELVLQVHSRLSGSSAYAGIAYCANLVEGQLWAYTSTSSASGSIRYRIDGATAKPTPGSASAVAIGSAGSTSGGPYIQETTDHAFFAMDLRSQVFDDAGPGVLWSSRYLRLANPTTPQSTFGTSSPNFWASAYDASWYGLPSNRVGLAMYFNDTVEASKRMDVVSWKIYEMP